MNKKLQTISMLSATVLMMTLTGCDWCSCCKKDSKPAKSEMAAPKEAHPVVEHTEPVEPKMMPEHPMEPKAMPVMPMEPKVAPMPSEPKAI